jgi:hypothetical protein
MSRGELEQKFRRLVEPEVGESQATEIIEVVDELETLSDIKELIRLIGT